MNRLSQAVWGLHFLATVAKIIILTTTNGEGIQYRDSRCVERGLARYSPTEEFLIVVEGSAFYEKRAPEMVARGSSGTLSGTRCVCEAQTQDDVSSGGRLCRRVPPWGRVHVSGRNGRAVQVPATEAIVSSTNSKKASVGRTHAHD